MHEIIEKVVVCRNRELVLTNTRGIFLSETRTLAVADLHMGKTAHFRRHGIAIPSSVMLHDLERLSALVRHFMPLQLVVVGDMFHAAFNADLHLFLQWREQFPDLLVHLVKGNHDRLKENRYHELGINSTSLSLDLPPFMLVHDAEEPTPGRLAICGHIHPGRTIHGKGKQWLKLPCYLLSDTKLVLPAFSHFTGLDTSVPEELHECYVVTDKGIFKV